MCISTNVELVMTFEVNLRNLSRSNPSLGAPPYRATIASSPSILMSSLDETLLKLLAHSLKCKSCVAFLRACPFPTPNNLDVVSHPVIA